MNKIDCLDHGYVSLVDMMPSNVSPEYRVAQAARISFDKLDQEANPVADATLVRYLYENNHTSPLEMVEFMFEICCPQFVATHFHRHRTANINEQSQRYTEIADDFYHISTDIRKQSKTNKQGSVTDTKLAEKMYGKCQRIERIIAEQVLPLYHDIIGEGVAKEVARACLPRSMYTKMVYKMDANNLLKFLSLRCAPDTQKETRVFADAMKELIRPYIPTLIACLEERQQSVYLRPDEIISLHNNTVDQLSVRRKAELNAKHHRIRRKKLIVLIGYRRTGKDTLCQYLIEKKDISPLYPQFRVDSNFCINGKRLALADALKEEVDEYLKTRFNITEITDKDKKQFIDNPSTPAKSARDYYIEHGQKRRQQDPNYWLDLVLDQINNDTEHDIIITDCRFPNELNAFKQIANRDVVTIRLYRQAVPIDDLDPTSEHSLDDQPTDFLLTDMVPSTPFQVIQRIA